MGGKGKGKGVPPPPPKAQTAEELEQAKLEAQRKKQQEMQERSEMQERERADAEARLALKAQLPRMHGFDIFGTIPWSKARMTVRLEGSREGSSMQWSPMSPGPGVTVVDLGSDQVVCVRHVKEIVSEFMAEQVAIALKVPVARSRIVRPDDTEYSEIEAMKKRCRPIIFEKEVKKYLDLADDPSSPVWEEFRKANPEHYPGMVKMAGRRSSVAVLEFVQGSGLGSLSSEEALLLNDTAVWKGMGRLCALDVLLNNMDRLPIPVFDNREGNVSNVLVTSKEAIGIDQQINVISDDAGIETYLGRVESFVQEVMKASQSEKHGDASSNNNEDISAVMFARIKAAGVMMQESHLDLLFEGLRMGFAEVAQGWKSGTLGAAIDEAEVAARERIVASQKLLEDGAWTSPEIESSVSNEEAHKCASFLCKVAAKISDAVANDAQNA